MLFMFIVIALLGEIVVASDASLLGKRKKSDIERVVSGTPPRVLSDSPGRGLYKSPDIDIIKRIDALIARGISSHNKIVLLNLKQQYLRHEIDATKIRTILISMNHKTPQHSHKRVRRELVKFYGRKILGAASPGDYGEANDALLRSLAAPPASSDARYVECLAAVVEGEESDAALFTATRMNHVKNPQYKRSCKGKIRGVSGGHAVEKHSLDALNKGLLTLSGVFSTLVGAVNSEGFGGVKKTMMCGLTSEKIAQWIRDSRHIGTIGELHYYRTTGDVFIGCHASSPRALERKSLFPLAVIDLSKAIIGGVVKIGSIASYDFSSSSMVRHAELTMTIGQMKMILGAVGRGDIVHKGGVGGRLINVTSQLSSMILSHTKARKIPHLYVWLPDSLSL